MNKELWKLVDPLIEDRFTTEWDKLNYKYIPVTVIEAKPGNESIYNQIYRFLLEQKHFQPIKRTESGGVSIAIIRRFTFDQYDIRQLGSVNEITIVTLEKSCRIQWRINNMKTETGEKLVSASSYFKSEWIPTCKKHGIEMTDYKNTEEEGLEAKQEIHKPDIKIYNIGVKYRPMNNIHHIDYHKFYMSGLINTHPEFRPVVDELLTKEDAKIGLASIIGLFQSKYRRYEYAKLSRDAINDAYSRYDKLKEDLIRSGRKIILTNTDGIWYQGEIYHGEGEGPNLTEWQNDHTNCMLWCKTPGSYQYIEDGKCHTVVRGHTKRDKIIPRDEWEFGDIFDESCDAKYWTFKEGVGIVWQE